jgi:hypothetical protein
LDFLHRDVLISHPFYFSVGAVNPDYVIYTTRDAEGKTVQHTIPTNFVLWSTGIAMNPFTQRVSNLLPNQVHKKAIEVDAHLRVKGAPLGEVYAIGDCATVSAFSFPWMICFDLKHDRLRPPSSAISWTLSRKRIRTRMERLISVNGSTWVRWLRLLENSFADCYLSPVKKIKHRIPMAGDHLVKVVFSALTRWLHSDFSHQVKELFDMYDSDADNNLSLNELVRLLEEIGNKITALPAVCPLSPIIHKY